MSDPKDAARPADAEPNVKALIDRAGDWCSRMFDYEVADNDPTEFEVQAQEIIKDLLLVLTHSEPTRPAPPEGPARKEELCGTVASAAPTTTRTECPANGAAGAITGSGDRGDARPGGAPAPADEVEALIRERPQSEELVRFLQKKGVLPTARPGGAPEGPALQHKDNCINRLIERGVKVPCNCGIEQLQARWEEPK